MISLCLKSLDKELINNLEKEIDKIEFNNIIYIQKKLSKFHNLIIHYVGQHKNDFYKVFSEAISNFVISNYEDKLILKQLRLEFFYFSKSEQLDILNSTKNALTLEDCNHYKKRILQNQIFRYISNTHKFNIDGFVNFRIPDYKKYICSKLDEEVHNYIIKKEYLEYITLLRDYISVKPSQSETIHLIYSNNESILIDGSGNILTTTDEKKYLSDISFSKNDFILNSILSLLPRKLIIHSSIIDNFLQFLQSVFENRCELCLGCKLCKSDLNECKKCLN